MKKFYKLFFSLNRLIPSTYHISIVGLCLSKGSIGGYCLIAVLLLLIFWENLYLLQESINKTLEFDLKFDLIHYFTLSLSFLSLFLNKDFEQNTAMFDLPTTWGEFWGLSLFGWIIIVSDLFTRDLLSKFSNLKKML